MEWIIGALCGAAAAAAVVKSRPPAAVRGEAAGETAEEAAFRTLQSYSAATAYGMGGEEG